MIVRGTFNFFAFPFFITDILSRAMLSACTVYRNTLIGLANFESLGIWINCTVSMTGARYFFADFVVGYFVKIANMLVESYMGAIFSVGAFELSLRLRKVDLKSRTPYFPI